jgi:hypothetical protein
MPEMDEGARLEVNAALIGRLIAVQDGRIVARWRRPGFGRSVDAVRRQLGPIRDRAALCASYGREAGRARRPGADHWIGSGRSVALEVAYALRWSELEHGRPSRPFASIVASATGRRPTLTTTRATG